jgi:hypothetical protein
MAALDTTAQAHASPSPSVVVVPPPAAPAGAVALPVPAPVAVPAGPPNPKAVAEFAAQLVAQTTIKGSSVGKRELLVGSDAVTRIQVTPELLAITTMPANHGFLKKLFGVYAAKGSQHRKSSSFDTLAVENETMDLGEFQGLLMDFGFMPLRLSKDAAAAIFKARAVSLFEKKKAGQMNYRELQDCLVRTALFVFAESKAPTLSAFEMDAARVQALLCLFHLAVADPTNAKKFVAFRSSAQPAQAALPLPLAGSLLLTPSVASPTSTSTSTLTSISTSTPPTASRVLAAPTAEDSPVASSAPAEDDGGDTFPVELASPPPMASSPTSPTSPTSPSAAEGGGFRQVRRGSILALPVADASSPNNTQVHNLVHVHPTTHPHTTRGVWLFFGLHDDDKILSCMYVCMYVCMCAVLFFLVCSLVASVMVIGAPWWVMNRCK